MRIHILFFISLALISCSVDQDEAQTILSDSIWQGERASIFWCLRFNADKTAEISNLKMIPNGGEITISSSRGNWNLLAGGRLDIALDSLAIYAIENDDAGIYIGDRTHFSEKAQTMRYFLKKITQNELEYHQQANTGFGDINRNIRVEECDLLTHIIKNGQVERTENVR